MLNEFISRVRRNHGLEHATIHILTARHQNFSAQGNSDHRGFNLNIYGNISETDVRTAVQEAYARLKAGEHHLAIHPNCGTVLLTTATLAVLAAQSVFTAEQKRQQRLANDWLVMSRALPSAIFAVVIALITGKPLGIQLQAQYTVEGDLKEMEVISVRRVRNNPITWLFQLLLTNGRSGVKAAAYRIETRG